MVGASKTRRGCQQCLVRKIKCDEARPACGSCVKYNTRCPGYQQRGLKLFVAGKHAVKPRGRQQQLSSVVQVGPPHPDSDPSVPGTEQTVIVLSHTAVGGRRRQESRNKPRAPQPVTALEKLQAAVVRKHKVLGAPRHNTTLFVGALVESMYCALPRDEEFLPDIWNGAAAGMHRSPALMTALCAIGSHLLLYFDDMTTTLSRF
ncbi:hypothetical protein PFICI_08276 [Pestalotiopsis fici W106-1]|uniref:Zn(2)-C6 fungal-type domain-containing protein n=1 Tax=Pestalotiopsis fici (strain W106-1 / CGMCC3.15140) TaxID=1229662 RepID=W3X5V3_PESFW|nr:uncharacterized protein PFICI_08276 [Pestalotiopsis fici W106-1]ETS80747.1 hypothetical protein PFICI_08276 [Pestalotiopsis fici W106-1]